VKPTPLNVGDACWLLLDTILHEVTILDVTVLLEGGPTEFCMYKVSSKWPGIERDSHHRSDLFHMPTERELLLERLDGDILCLTEIRDDLQRERDSEHEENPRVKGDDDGVEYGHPRDHKEQR
jgi:hypothetical protein